MCETKVAERLERALGSIHSGAASSPAFEELDEDLRGRGQVAHRLVLDLGSESRLAEGVQRRLRREMNERPSWSRPPAPRKPWFVRRPILASELAVVMAVLMLAIIAPRSVAAFVEPIVRMIVLQIVRVGEHTEIIRAAPQTPADVAATLQESARRFSSGQSWHLDTPYSGFGGAVPAGRSAAVQRVTDIEALERLTTMPIRVPSCLHRNEPVRFDHAFVAPDGWVFIFFGSGRDEILLSQSPVGNGRSVGYGRMGNRTTPEGRMVFESPEVRAEELSLGGQTLVWCPDPESKSFRPATPFSSGTWSPRRSDMASLMWEEDGVSYAIMGRSLTRDEATALYLSLGAPEPRR